VGWDELTDGDGDRASAVVRPGQEWDNPVIRVLRRNGGASRPLLVQVARLEGDPVQLRHALAWFAQHPEYRDELEDDRASARVVEGRAVVPELVGREG